MRAKKPNNKVLQQLTQPTEGVALSLVIPTHPSSPPDHIKEDRSRFNSAIKEAVEQLEAQEIESARFEERLRVIHEDIEFWRYQAAGLAVYMDEKSTHLVGLPREPETMVIVNDAFHVSPLLLATQLNRQYLIIQPSYKNPQVVQADWYDLRHVELTELPTSIEDALNIDGYEFEQQYNPVPRPGTSDHAIYHGHGGADDAKDHERFHYHTIIDKILASYANASARTVILAGTDEEVAAYRDLSKIRHIAEPTIKGNIQTLSKEDFQKEIQNAISAIVEAEQEELAHKLEQKNVLFDYEKINEAIESGRVGSLFVGLKHETADHTKEGFQERPVYTHESPEPAAVDIDESIAGALAFGGDVIGVDRSLMPQGTLMAATLRF